MKEYKFRARIEAGGGGGALVKIPFDVRKEFGTGGQVKVRVTFQGHPYRGSIAPMGGGSHILGIRKSIREAIGKTIGDTVAVVLLRDTLPRTVAVPPELKKTLARSAKAKAVFGKLSYTHRREYAEWVAGAKKQETRDRRAENAIRKLVGAVPERS